MATRKPVLAVKLGDRVKVGFTKWRGRIVELRGPLGPKGSASLPGLQPGEAAACRHRGARRATRTASRWGLRETGRRGQRELFRNNSRFYEEPAVKSKLHFFSVSLLGMHFERRPQIASCNGVLPLVAGVMPPKRTGTLGQDSPLCPDSDLLCTSQQTTPRHASGLAASGVAAVLALAQAVPAMPATDLYTCRRTSVPLRTAGRSTTIDIRPLAIRRSLVPGRPFCPAAAAQHARVCFDRPDQSSTRRSRHCACFAVLPSRTGVL